MPAKSKAQQRLMQAAEHGANFPMARKIRQSMTHQQLHDFAVGSEQDKPTYAPHPARNLGPHLKSSSTGEIVTNHHRGAKRRKG
ncbi:MAG TPA: hypothetical protein VNL16_03535 [Chloroflexota bacterium]|nr:hypothetical protein [Chloroflexota bacterium]